MTDIQTKQLEFLKDTINHFNSSNRGVNFNGRCCYSAGCAIGRHIPDKELCKEMDEYGDTIIIMSNYLYNKLPESLKELGQSYLDQVQDLHDDDRSWDKNGLTDHGKMSVNKICDYLNIPNFFSVV
jgi:hypothetical protein